VRNPQHLFWDPKTGNMFMSDIGQNIVEEISPVTSGANLGWNAWEGNYRYISRNEVGLSDPRSDGKITYPIVEYGQIDPLLQPSSAAIGGYIYRQKAIPQLANLLLFGDNPSGEIFYVNADNLPKGGQDPIRRVLFNDKGESKTLLQLIKEKNAAQGKAPAARADLRFGQGPDGQIFILNKRDGTIRLLVP
jgi:glucose/arabinose dehydrogenase